MKRYIGAKVDQNVFVLDRFGTQLHVGDLVQYHFSSGGTQLIGRLTDLRTNDGRICAVTTQTSDEDLFPIGAREYGFPTEWYLVKP